MADTQYDVPEKIIKLFRMKEEKRLKAKSYFIKMLTNPHRPINEARPFDSQVFRFCATHAYAYEFYKNTPKNMFGMFAYVVVPFFCLYGTLLYGKHQKESKLRAGLVAYKDRFWKRIY